MSKGNLLTLLILVGLIAGVLVGHFVLHSAANPIDESLRRTGELILIRPLMLLVVPLVFVSIVAGVSRIGDLARVGLVGGASLVYFFVSMLLAATLGAAMASVLAPSSALSPAEVQSLREFGEAQLALDPQLQQDLAEPADAGIDRAWQDLIEQLVPRDIVNETTQSRPLGLMLFAALLGLALAAGGERAKPAVRLFDLLFDALIRIVSWISWLAPIGVFLLVAWTIGTVGLEHFSASLRNYVLAVVGGLAIHGLIILPLILLVLGRANPLLFLWRMRVALLTALGTASSIATMPIALDVAIRRGWCSKSAASVVIPLGSTINKNGTALFQSLAVVMLFQIHGIQLEFGQLLIVVIMATLAASRTAGVPSAALVTMLVVITAVNTSLAGTGKELSVGAIAIVVGVDRILDMCRTGVNVWSNLVGAKILTKLAPETIETSNDLRSASPSP
jgi:Na+/H+-dicarboxylate symporter